MNSNVEKRINFFLLIIVVILIYNYFISFLFNINPLNFLQYFDWMSTSQFLGGDLHSCCIYGYSETLVPTHPYPPFSYIFFRLVNFLFNIKNDDNFSINFQLFYLFYVSIILMVSVLLINEKVKNNSIKVQFFSTLVLFSNWVIGSIIVGNLSLITLPMLLFFMFFHNSEDLICKELSLLTCALAFNLKLIPIVFAFVLVCNKDYKSFVRLTTYSAIIFFFSILVFNNTSYVNIIFEYLSCLFKYSVYNIDRVGGGVAIYLFFSKLNFFPSLLAKIISKSFFVVLLIYAIYFKDVKQRILAITLAAVFVGPAYPHYCVIFIIPFIYYIVEKNKFRVIDIMIFSILLLINLPIKYYFLPSFYNQDESLFKTIVTERVTYLLFAFITFDFINQTKIMEYIRRRLTVK